MNTTKDTTAEDKADQQDEIREYAREQLWEAILVGESPVQILEDLATVYDGDICDLLP